MNRKAGARPANGSLPGPVTSAPVIPVKDCPAAVLGEAWAALAPSLGTDEAKVKVKMSDADAVEPCGTTDTGLASAAIADGGVSVAAGAATCATATCATGASDVIPLSERRGAAGAATGTSSGSVLDGAALALSAVRGANAGRSDAATASSLGPGVAGKTVGRLTEVRGSDVPGES